VADEPDTAPENQDTPNVEPDAPDTGTREQQIDWEKRYQDLRSDYDRRNQQWSEVQQRLDTDPRGFLEEIGYDLSDDEGETPDYEDDPLEAIRAEVEQLKADREAQHTEAEAYAIEQAELGFINNELGALAKEHGRDFSQEEIDAIGDLSRARPTPEGTPNVRGAYETVFKTILSRAKEDWVQSKGSPQVLAGAAGVENVDLDNPRERQDYFAQRLAQIDAEQ
jgi:hypothetical protein